MKRYFFAAQNSFVFLIALLLGTINNLMSAETALRSIAATQSQNRMTNDNPLRLLLPPEIQAVPGRETSVYFSNIILAINPKNYAFDVTCDKGIQQDDRWTFTPQTEDVGNFSLKIDVRDSDNRLLGSVKTTLRVVAADAGAGREISWLMIGDSMTHASVYPEEILRLCSGSENPKLTLIGTHHPYEKLPQEVRHEGYGGWTAEYFATHFVKHPVSPDRNSPFLYFKNGAPQFNFSRYVKEHAGGRAPDIITIMLGCNDNFMSTDENIDASIDKMLYYDDLMLQEFRAAGPATKIGLVLTVPPPESQNGFGNSYKCGQTRWQYRRNQHRIMERMIAHYKNRERENIFLVPASTGLDPANGFGGKLVSASARISLEAMRGQHDVHPSTEGYLQIADIFYCWFKSIL